MSVTNVLCRCELSTVLVTDAKFVSLLKIPMVTTESGLQYKDIKVGQGPSPPVGFQVCNFKF